MYVCMYVFMCMHACIYECTHGYTRARMMYVLQPLLAVKIILLEDITTEPHAHDISADILRIGSEDLFSSIAYKQTLYDVNGT